MFSIYLSIVKHKDHFTFAISILLSSFLLLNNDNPRMSILRGKSAEIVAFLSSPFTWVQSLVFLEKENQLLREKNLLLSLKIESMLNLDNKNKELLEMLDFKKETELTIKPAKVVSKGIQPNLLSIIINSGSLDGIKNNQAVLTPKGVIGKTINTSDKATIIQLISDSNFRISVRILPSGATGILRFLNGETAQIREVQKNIPISIGDKVVTSGFSDIYHPGLPVGTVAGVYAERGSFQKIVNVSLPNDLSSFQYVFVIIDKINEVD